MSNQQFRHFPYPHHPSAVRARYLRPTRQHRPAVWSMLGGWVAQDDAGYLHRVDAREGLVRALEISGGVRPGSDPRIWVMRLGHDRRYDNGATSNDGLRARPGKRVNHPGFSGDSWV